MPQPLKSRKLNPKRWSRKPHTTKKSLTAGAKLKRPTTTPKPIPVDASAYDPLARPVARNHKPGCPCPFCAKAQQQRAVTAEKLGSRAQNLRYLDALVDKNSPTFMEPEKSAAAVTSGLHSGCARMTTSGNWVRTVWISLSVNFSCTSHLPHQPMSW